jgi:hypothetical protein
MSELSELLALLSVLYLLECAQLVPRGAVAVQSILPGRFAARAAARFGLRRDTGLVLGIPHPPLGLTFVVEPWPVDLGPDGIAGRPWAAARAAEAAGGQVVVDGATVATLSEPAAAAVAEALRRIAAVDGKRREKLVDEVLRRRLDGDAVKERVRGFARATRPLRAAENALFLALFAGAPLLVRYGELRPFWPYVAGLGVAAWAAIAALLAWRHECGPRRVVALALWPLSAIRASDRLARGLLADVEPLAAATLLPPAGFRDAARRALAELRHRPTPAGWFEQRLERAVIRLVREQKVDPDELFAPPERDSDASRAFCPRCRAQYVRDVACCSSCPEIRLLPY